MPVVPYPQNEPSPEAVAAKARDGANELLSLTTLLTHPMVMKLDGGVLVGYRGSLAQGTKGPHKGNKPFDPSDFDVDAFIVSDKLAARFRQGTRFRSAWKIDELKSVQTAIDRSLRQNPNFSGLRPEKFTFKIVTKSEFTALRRDGDMYVIIKSK